MYETALKSLKDSMKIVCISDTHGLHKDISLPAGDILIHAGDATMLGTHDELERFITWFAAQPFKYKIFVPGNHDMGLETDLTAFSKFHTRRGRKVPDLEHTRTSIELHMEKSGVTYLNNSSIEIEGLKIYGAPDQPAFCGWGFNRTNSELTEIWKKIPDDTNILITHAPAYTILDELEDGTMVGDVPLMKRINTLPKLKVHICGHIHPSHGMIEVNGVTHINASILDDDYRIAHKPIELDV